ncbi:phosphopantetheine-binding protein [Cohnella laeviribosi]|jgi:acyl carrier protein|uniref:phosphopantetheine-binding protein n=1 Tax=Cohnella laeviribosi TaxID=380174 RepID=UPI000377D8CC|nr:phosphopantetheine-binding protein [Cohnella laeviribosi]
MDKMVQAIIDSIREISKGNAAKEITQDSRLFEDLNMDSVTIIELLVSLELKIDCFEARPEDMVPENFETVGKLAEYIRTSLGVANP